MNVIDEIAAERRRQVDAEGWTAEHDDQHRNGALAKAAACYAYFGGTADNIREVDMVTRPQDVKPEVSSLIVIQRMWPGWAWSWWKPKDRRRDLIRAAALIVAEIERIDRQQSK